MNIMQQIALMSAQANETEEERADRIKQSAAETGADPTTLYHVEEDLRNLARRAAKENEEKVAEAEQVLKAYAPMLGLDPKATDELGAEMGIKLASMKILTRPDLTARLVKTLHESFERRGLYAELGTETPTPGEVEPTVSVDPTDDTE